MKSLETKLADRVLRFDGVSIISPEMVARCLMLGVSPTQIRVTEAGWEVEQFNANVDDDLLLKVAAPEPVNLDFTWQLEAKWRELDLTTYVGGIMYDRLSEFDYSSFELDRALTRITAELGEVKLRGMTEFMRTICYVLHVFREKGVVWGVGRGSSCASYILFVLGLHAVDCTRLDVPMEEFFHD